jgi:two-component sensor histidine kinase
MVDVDADALAINADYAVPVGLFVNELATNAIKHAFPDGKDLILLGFRRRDGGLILSIEDSTGMGTRFVDAFVRQIGGTLARANGHTDTTITVRLPVSIPG